MSINIKPKQIAYVVIGIIYTILVGSYGKEPLLRLMVGIPKQTATFIFLGILLVPLLILMSLALEDEIKKNQSREHWSKPLWAGDVPLLKAFFAYNLLGTLFIIVMEQFLYFRLANVDLTWRNVVVILAAVGSTFWYQTISTVGTLRSSSKFSGSKIWVLIAKVGVVFTSIAIVIGFILALNGVNMFHETPSVKCPPPTGMNEAKASCVSNG